MSDITRINMTVKHPRYDTTELHFSVAGTGREALDNASQVSQLALFVLHHVTRDESYTMDISTTVTQ